jgi:hypothetical protein
MVTEIGVGDIVGVAHSLLDRLLGKNEVVVGGALLSACRGGALSGLHKYVRRERPTAGNSPIHLGTDYVTCRDSAGLHCIVAGLHWLECGRLLTFLYLHQGGLDPVDCCRLSVLLLHGQRLVGHCNCSHVICAPDPSLHLLQRRQPMVDSTHRRKPTVLRVGILYKHHRSWGLAKRGSPMAFARHLYCDYFGSDRFLHFSPLLSFSLVNRACFGWGKKPSSPVLT